MRPTIVINGVAQPTQWGAGTWQVDAERDTSVAVFLFVGGATFGRASSAIGESGATYVAPRLPFGRGKFLN